MVIFEVKDSVMGGDWHLTSWRKYPIEQQPCYEDEDRYREILERISKLPPLVFSGEVEKLRELLAEASEGKRFILHGGNCAERFIDCNEETITNQLKILLQMSVILTYGARKPVVRIGRIAGQYAKPRSNEYEEVGGVKLAVYRGDLVNSIEPTPLARRADPERMLMGYFCSATTLNYIRAMIDGGFADLHHPYNWNLHSIEKSPRWPQYKHIVENILDAINFMESFGGIRPEMLGRIDFFTSHEGLVLDYETALTRRVGDRYYNLGAHMLWIGERTRKLGYAHVEYFRGISNPIGIKIGPTCKPSELKELVELLNPDDQPGRLVLITRLGADNVEVILPALIEAVRSSDRSVCWSCDPMHGNTIVVNGKKTRNFSVILKELELTFNIHKKMKSILSGVHFELTGDDVTECIGGAVDLHEEDLEVNYQTYCDPRLNYAQSLEMAFLINQLLNDDLS